MVFLEVKFIDCRNTVVPDCWTNDDMSYWPLKNPQVKVRRGELLKTCWAQYVIKRISVFNNDLTVQFCRVEDFRSLNGDGEDMSFDLHNFRQLIVLFLSLKINCRFKLYSTAYFIIYCLWF